MNSCLYKARVMHHRLEPKKHRFQYDVFLFYLDLDELATLARNLKFMSLNRFNLFNFRDKDHLRFPRQAPDEQLPVKQQIINYLRAEGLEQEPARIMLVTNLATLGHQFNPVSFYYCFDENDQPVAAVVEICNTFREMKPFFLGNNRLQGGVYQLRQQKNFYVSPFIDHDVFFDFTLSVPGEQLNIRIDDYSKDDRRFFISTLTGDRKPLTDANLLRYFFSFPLITIKVLAMIHWQAFRLWLKKIPFHRKSEHPELQQEVYRPYK